VIFPPDGVDLVEAGVAHSPVVAELHRRCFDEAWSAFTVRQILDMPGAFGVLAVESVGAGEEVSDMPRLLGFALCRAAGGECELLSLAVTSLARKGGIGAALLGAAIDRARKGTIKRMFLEVAEDNTVAQRLYEAHGFRPVGRRPNYYRRRQGPAMAALTYAVSLKGPSADSAK
jgi:ribosomal-protein-alanine N-acetyltransferase